MREILFRGKRTDNGEWIYGNLIRYLNGESSILEIGGLRIFSVVPSTVGQYTGLCDKNGKRIFEGDIVSTLSGKTFEVKFADGSFFLYGTSIAINHAKRFLVVGNRLDNPELLEVDE